MSSRTRRGPAATRTAAPRAEGRPRVPRARALLAASVALLATAGCAWIPGYLSDEDQVRLETHKRNSKAYYEIGDYVRAVDQCRRGLEIEQDESLELTLGYALLMQAEPKALEEAALVFSEQIGFFGSDDWRLHMGYGMTLQQLARAKAAATDEKAQADAARLRAQARTHLEAAATAKEAPAEVPYNLALLDLEEEHPDLFPAHAAKALAKLKERQKFLTVQLRQPMGEREHDRTERDRRINEERGRRISRESARAAWEHGDWPGASAAMNEIENFGGLQRADFYDRARVRERNGDIEGAVKDLVQFVDQSGDQVDELVTQAVNLLSQLRSKLAEQRTATTPLSSGR